MDEKRKLIRRTVDRQLLKTVDHQQSMLDRMGARDARKAQRERRRFLRHKCKVRIEMIVGGTADSDTDESRSTVKVKGHLVDLSIDGASLSTKHPFETRQALHLAIMFPDESTISSDAMVRWVKPAPEKGDYVSGVEFAELSEQDQGRLLAFFRELNAAAGGA